VSAALLIILFLGGVLGLSVGLVGTGSVLAVPLLVYGGGLGVHNAVCMSMLTMTLLGIVGSIQKLHAGAINLRAATFTAIFGALFAPLGAWLNKQLRPHSSAYLLRARSLGNKHLHAAAERDECKTDDEAAQFCESAWR
jgi:uncharacterized membrane protein YfcA